MTSRASNAEVMSRHYCGVTTVLKYTLNEVDKECHRCHVVKPLSEFNKDKNAPGGKDRWCKDCKREYYGFSKQHHAPFHHLTAPEGYACCAYCGVQYEFTKDNFQWSARNGLTRKCRDCSRRMGREHHKAHPEQARIRQARRDPAHERERSRIYRENNPEKVKESGLRWREKNRERQVIAARDWQKRNPDRHYANKRQHRKEHAEQSRAYGRNRRARKLLAGGTHTADDVKLLFKSQRGKCWWCGKNVDPKKYHVDHRIPLSRGGSNAPENLCISCIPCNLSKNNKLPQEWNGRLL